MKLNFRQGADARQIAEVHQELGMAAKLLRQAVEVQDEHYRSVLNAPSQDALMRLVERIRLSMYGLEGAFVRAAGSNTPFANTDNPAAWLEWLEQRESDVGLPAEPSA